MPIIKRLSDNSIIERDRGTFDEWCVYLTRPQIPRHAPRDRDYFQRLIELSGYHTSQRIYDDFVRIYEITNTETSPRVLEFITEIASSYGDDSVEMDILYTILYLGMVAEENKTNTRLGKRIKRLGMHQILIDNVDALTAANFSRGMRWQQISTECENKGF